MFAILFILHNMCRNLLSGMVDNILESRKQLADVSKRKEKRRSTYKGSSAARKCEHGSGGISRKLVH